MVWLYDLYARRYDAIKQWDIGDEIDYLAGPFMRTACERQRLSPIVHRQLNTEH